MEKENAKRRTAGLIRGKRFDIFRKKSYRGRPKFPVFYIIINRETGRVKPEPLTGSQEAVKKIPAH